MHIVDLTELDKMSLQVIQKDDKDKPIRMPLELPDKPRRKVTLEVNTTEMTRFRVETGTDIRFLADIDGRGRLIFWVDGPCCVGRYQG